MTTVLSCYPLNEILKPGIYSYNGESFQYFQLHNYGKYLNTIVFGYSWGNNGGNLSPSTQTPITSVTDSIAYFMTNGAFTSIFGYITVNQNFIGSNSIDVYSDRNRKEFIKVATITYEVANVGKTDIAVNLPSTYTSWWQGDGVAAYIVVNNDVVCDFSNLYIQTT